jgi:hypothetical protein
MRLTMTYLREINSSVVVSINLGDHFLKLSLSGVLSKGAHDDAKLLGSDASCMSKSNTGLALRDKLMRGQKNGILANCEIPVAKKARIGNPSNHHRPYQRGRKPP